MLKKLDFKKSLKLCRGISVEAPEMPPCDFVPNKYEGKNYAEMQAARQKHIAPCITAMYKKPLLVHQGHMQWLYDDKGKRYLDMFGGIVTVSVGHCHPKVVEATSKQIRKLWHTTNIYLHPNIHEYAEKLTAKLPEDLKVVYFVNSGSEANDLAMLMARLHTGNFDIISLRNAYHGMSNHTMGITAQSTWRHHVPANNGIHHAMNPDPYKGLWGGKNCRDSPIQTDRNCDCEGNDCHAGNMYYDQLEEVFRYSLPQGRVAGMFAESIQGVGGTIIYPKNYIKKAYDLIHANGGLYIADEVQTGFGRTGDHFWGFEMHDITPDIVTMAKGIGNGFPMGAVVTTPKIAECLSKALHFNTFGGNPIACAVGQAVLEVMEEEKTQQLAKNIGTYLMEQLNGLKDKLPVIGDVRGKGLMIGVELVQEGTKVPLGVPHMANFIENCKDMGLLIGKGGMTGNVLRIKPPMCITKEDADFTVNVIEKSLQLYTQESRKRRPEYGFLSNNKN